MWPESLTAGGINGGRIYKAVLKKMKKYYRRDKKVFITSRGFRQMLVERGVPDEKIVYLPNWCDESVEAKDDSIKLPHLPSGFVVMFAGNLGEAQNMENVLQAAKILRNEKDIHFVFVGDGRKKQWMDDFVAAEGLADTVFLAGRYPSSAMMSFFEKASVLLVSLSDTLVFNMTLPAKVQSYMAAGKPILGVLKGEGAEIIAEAECGWSADPANPQAIADKIVEISKMQSGLLQELGAKGYGYYKNHFTRDICMDILDKNMTV